MDFKLFLQRINIKPEISELYREILKDVFNESKKERQVELKRIEKELEQQKERLSKIDEMLIESKIDDTAHK